MPDFDFRRVPAGTTEITYTDDDGAQVSILVSTLDGGAYAYTEPRSSADVTVLDGFGWTTVARKAMGQDEPADTPVTPPEPPAVTDTTGPGNPDAGEEG